MWSYYRKVVDWQADVRLGPTSCETGMEMQVSQRFGSYTGPPAAKSPHVSQTPSVDHLTVRLSPRLSQIHAGQL